MVFKGGLMPRKHKRIASLDPPKARKCNPVAKALATPVCRPQKIPNRKKRYVEQARERDAHAAITEGD